MSLREVIEEARKERSALLVRMHASSRQRGADQRKPEAQSEAARKFILTLPDRIRAAMKEGRDSVVVMKWPEMYAFHTSQLVGVEKLVYDYLVCEGYEDFCVLERRSAGGADCWCELMLIGIQPKRLTST